MLSARQTTIQLSRPYAKAADFCRIFESDLNRLYLLAFMLTADHALAEECFVRGLEDSTRSSRVFREWAHSWARRTVIHNAIQMLRPRPINSSASGSRSGQSARHTLSEPASIAAIVELPAFERFALVMSVLERHSDQECSLLLGCTRDDVIAGRIRALQQVGRTAELHSKCAGISAGEQARPEEPGAAIQMQTIPRLAASA